MIRYACGMAAAIFLLVEAPSGWSQQYYLYSPATVASEAAAQGRDGVLVREVTVKKGDTLSGISHKFSRHGSYYPQILLFNTIKNPNRIYPGNVFRVPVPRNSVAVEVDKSPGTPPVVSAMEISGHDLKKVAGGREKKRTSRKKAALAAKKQGTSDKQHTAGVKARDAAAGQKLFERAVKAYRGNDFQVALELFDRFLVENQASPLAADASLYKAECYLKLSTQN